MRTPHRQLLRLLLGPGALLVVVLSAFVAIKGLGWNSPEQIRWIAVASLLFIVLMLFVLRRLQSGIDDRTRIRYRERNLMEQQRAFDRLHHGIQKLRNNPERTRWLKLAEQRRITDGSVIAGWERRYQELLAHPTRKAWAAQALEGNFPSDDEIDYESHPHLLLTCVHLQPLESAIRQAGIYCSALSPTSIVTYASLHAQKVVRQFALPSFLEWETGPSEAGMPVTTSLICRPCTSRIQSGHGEPFPP